MASNVVDYKLCDREFDCDNCFFDKSMRNIQHQYSSKDIEDKKTKLNKIIQSTIRNIETAEFNSQYSYFRNHLVAKHLFANTYYLGFSPVAIDLLDSGAALEQCARVDKIKKGETVLKIAGAWGKIDVTAPVDFSYLGHVTEAHNSHERWFSLIETSKEELMNSSISVSDYHRDIINITKELTRFQRDYPDIGVTMLDGGIETKSLYQVIGSAKYNEILDTLFNKQ